MSQNIDISIDHSMKNVSIVVTLTTVHLQVISHQLVVNNTCDIPLHTDSSSTGISDAVSSSIITNSSSSLTSSLQSSSIYQSSSGIDTIASSSNSLLSSSPSTFPSSSLLSSSPSISSSFPSSLLSSSLYSSSIGSSSNNIGSSSSMINPIQSNIFQGLYLPKTSDNYTGTYYNSSIPTYVIGSVSPFTIFNANFSINSQIYVDSVLGNDGNSGNATHPIQSVFTAQLLARQLSMNSNNNVFVYLNGEFNLTRTWTFNAMDSASSTNNYVTYTSWYKHSPAILSGGVILPSNWTLYNAALNIWSLNIQSLNGFRNLYRMNGERVPLATSNSTSYYQGIQVIRGQAIDCSACHLPTIDKTINLEIQFIMQWAGNICPATMSTTYQITMNPQCNALFGTQAGNPRLYQLENALIFLYQPGTWVFDNSTIYYIPYSNENMTTIQFIVPQLTQLIVAHNITNVAFDNLQFMYTGWNQASINGVIPLQSDYLWTTQAFELFPGYGYDIDNQPNTFDVLIANHTDFLIPASVNFRNSTNLIVMNCVFTHMGLSALRINDYSSNGLVWNNLFYDLSASGLQLGTYSTSNMTVSHMFVQDNIIHDVGVEFIGSVGIFHEYVHTSYIDRNTIYNSPYIGISLGLGWNAGVNITYIPNAYYNILTRNLIYNCCQIGQDCAGIYVNSVTYAYLSSNVIYSITRITPSNLYGYLAGYGMYFDQGTALGEIRYDYVLFNLDNCCLTGNLNQYGCITPGAYASTNPNIDQYLYERNSGARNITAVLYQQNLMMNNNSSVQILDVGFPSTQLAVSLRKLYSSAWRCIQIARGRDFHTIDIDPMILDTVSAPTIMSFSTRQLFAGAIKCIQVTRSTDQTTMDIGFNSQGLLDNVTLLAFVGAGNTGYVTIWYNQSPLFSNSLIATSYTSAPIIVNNGMLVTHNGAVTVMFNGAQVLNLYMQLLTPFVSTIASRVDGNLGPVLGSNLYNTYYYGTVSDVLISAGNVQGPNFGVGSYAYVNNVTYSPATSAPWLSTQPIVMLQPNIVNIGTYWDAIGTDRTYAYLVGNYTELVIFNQTLTSSQIVQLYNSQFYFAG